MRFEKIGLEPRPPLLLSYFTLFFTFWNSSLFSITNLRRSIQDSMDFSLSLSKYDVKVHGGSRLVYFSVSLSPGQPQLSLIGLLSLLSPIAINGELLGPSLSLSLSLFFSHPLTLNNKLFREYVNGFQIPRNKKKKLLC